jgi:hypothetical protein
MKTPSVFVIILVLIMAGSACAIERQAFQMRDDYGLEHLSDCSLQYYYYIPCPTYSWFWAFTGWIPGDIIGSWFQVGDVSTGGFNPCDPTNCHVLEQFRVLDFAGYGQTHSGLFTVEFDIYCADEHGCPVGPSLWNSGRWETGFGWNYIDVVPPVSICDCSVIPGPPPSTPRILISAEHVGTNGVYPAWGFDNVSTPIEQGCSMHDIGCLPSLHPRPYSSHYAVLHSGFYGTGDFSYCPPQWFPDGSDTTPDGSQYGFLELAWRLYLTCSGPTETTPTTWGSIKSIYR